MESWQPHVQPHAPDVVGPGKAQRGEAAQHIQLPSPSVWPLLLSIAIIVFVAGLLFIDDYPWLSLITLLPVLIGILGWALEDPAHRPAPVSQSGYPPTTATGAMGRERRAGAGSALACDNAMVGGYPLKEEPTILQGESPVGAGVEWWAAGAVSKRDWPLGSPSVLLNEREPKEEEPDRKYETLPGDLSSHQKVPGRIRLLRAQQPQPPWQPPPTHYPPQQPYYQQPPVMVQPPPPEWPCGCLIANAGCLTAIAVLVALFLCGAIGSVISSQGSATPSPGTPQASDTPTPLTDMSAIDQQVQDDINNASLQGDNIRAGYGKYHNAFAIIGLQPPLTMSKSEQLALVQNDCFDGQKAVWTDPLLQNIGRMEVFVFTVDTQGLRPLPVTVGDCILHPNHAHKIDWNTTDALTAWNDKVYENMVPALKPVPKVTPTIATVKPTPTPKPHPTGVNGNP